MSDVTITITRKKKAPSSSGGSSRRKGVVSQSRNRQDLGRRRLKQDVQIRFWDFGQYANGDPVYPSFVDGNSGTMNDLIPPLNAEILAVPDPFNAFKPLDKASPVATELLLTYGAEVGRPADLDNYSGNTLSMSNDEFSTFSFGGTAGQFFAISSSFNIESLNLGHITNVPDPDAPDVELPNGSMDIGLAPAPVFQYGAVGYDVPPSSFLVDRLNFLYAVIERGSAPILAGSLDSDYASNYEKWRVMREQTHARADRSDGGPAAPIAPSAFAPSTYFPAPPAEPSGSETYNSVLGLNPAEPYADMLMAIIRKGSQLYYVWSGV